MSEEVKDTPVEVTEVNHNDENQEKTEVKERRPRKQYGVSDEEFCRVWQTASSANEAAEKLNMPKNIVLARSAIYRKKGINLKRMDKKTGKKLDVSKLNEQLASLS